MSRTTGRSLELLGLLQMRREWTGAELRDRLQVSARTLRRDIEDLRALGYGIDAAPGVGGGYRMGVGASIPPLVLSTEEAVAIAVGLRAAATAAVTGIEDSAALALAKLEQSLSNETRERILSVERAVLPLGPGADPVDLDTVVTIARAIRESRSLRIDYRRHEGISTRRTIQPHRIVHTGTRWYVVARDAERGAWRTLRLDRLTPHLPLAEPFVPSDMPDHDVRELTARSISVAPYPRRYRILMRASAAEVSAHFGTSTAVVTAQDARTCVLEAGAFSAEDFLLHVGLSGIDFEVLDGEQSDELRDKLAALSTRLQRAAGTM